MNSELIVDTDLIFCCCFFKMPVPEEQDGASFFFFFSSHVHVSKEEKSVLNTLNN